MFLFYSHTAAAAHLIDHLPEYICGLKTISLQNFESSWLLASKIFIEKFSIILIPFLISEAWGSESSQGSPLI